MSTRRKMTQSQRVAFFREHGGICHLCGLRIHAERGELWDAEHVKPLWNGGKDEPDNLRPAHKDCHAPKTKEEATQRAKTNRQAARHLGIVKSKTKIARRPKAPRDTTKTDQLREMRERRFMATLEPMETTDGQ